jgi:hypothetical protein
MPIPSPSQVVPQPSAPAPGISAGLVPHQLLMPGDPVTKKQAPTNHNQAVIAVYATHREAEDAIRTLHASGYEMRKLSIVGKDIQTKEDVIGYYTAGDRMKAWGTVGAVWGGFWGMMVGSAFFMIPGVGPLLVAGPLIGWITGALEGAVVVGGLSALGAGLFSIGIPKESVVLYEEQIRTGKYLVVAHGTPDQVKTTSDLFAASKHDGITTHPCT